MSTPQSPVYSPFFLLILGSAQCRIADHLVVLRLADQPVQTVPLDDFHLLDEPIWLALSGACCWSSYLAGTGTRVPVF